MEFGIFSQMHVAARRRRALALPARARGRRGRRRGRLQVRLVARAPLPQALLAPAGARGLPHLGGGADQAHPRRHRDHQHHGHGEPSGARRRAHRHDGPSLRGPRRVRHRARLVVGRVGAASTSRQRRRDQADVARVARADPAHVARRALRVRGQVLPHAEAQRAAEAVLEAAIRRCGSRARARRPSPRRASSASARSASPSARRREIAEHVEELQGRHQALQEADRRLHQRQHRRHHQHVLPATTATRRATSTAGAKVEHVHRATSSTGSTRSRARRACRKEGPVPKLPPTDAGGAEGRPRGRRPPDRLARGDHRGHQDVRGHRRRPAHLRAADHDASTRSTCCARSRRSASTCCRSSTRIRCTARRGSARRRWRRARRRERWLGRAQRDASARMTSRLRQGPDRRRVGARRRRHLSDHQSGHRGGRRATRRSARSSRRGGRARGARGVRARAVAAHERRRARRAAAARRRRSSSARWRRSSTSPSPRPARCAPVAETQQVGAVGLRLAKYAALAARPPQEALPPRDAARRQGTRPRRRHRRCASRSASSPASRPFNFPMTNCAGKIGPALACGNTVVVKPAPVDPLGVAELCRIVDSVLPPGVRQLRLRPGAGDRRGAVRVARRRHDLVHRQHRGRLRRSRPPRRARMKRTLLELGGKSPNIVFADADRDEGAAPARCSVWTFHSGPDLHRRHAAAGRGSRSTTSSPPQLAAAAPRAQDRRPARGRRRHRPAGLGGAARARRALHRHAASRRARRSPAAASGRRTCRAATTSSRRCSPACATT